MDLIYNECGLALAESLEIPSVGYWAFSFSCGEAEMTTAATPPSHIPVSYSLEKNHLGNRLSFSFQMFLSEQTDSMPFFGRLANFLNKVFARTLMYHHTSVCDGAIRRHIKVHFREFKFERIF